MTHHFVRRSLLALLAVAATSLTLAQGPASAPASGPGAGPMMGPGPMGGMRGWRGNRDNTPGWAMMSPAERDAHRDKIRSMSSYDECKAYMEQHHAQMVKRAKQRGRTAPAAPAPRHDPCAGLKK